MFYPLTDDRTLRPVEREDRLRRLAEHLGLTVEQSESGTVRLRDADREVFAQAGPDGYVLDVEAILAAPVLLEPTITQVLNDLWTLMNPTDLGLPPHVDRLSPEPETDE